MTDPVSIQRKYYEETAAAYEEMHLSETDAHHFALGWLASLINYNFESLSMLAAGSRTLKFLKTSGISIKMTGVEPVERCAILA